jgi:hypothetical protein
MMDSSPAYLRGGHIMARRERARRSTAAMAADPVTLVWCSSSLRCQVCTMSGSDPRPAEGFRICMIDVAPIAVCTAASQVVALNSSGNAEGDLYMDDGSSFAFSRGAYVHRHFRHGLSALILLRSDCAASKPGGPMTARTCSTALASHGVLWQVCVRKCLPQVCGWRADQQRVQDSRQWCGTHGFQPRCRHRAHRHPGAARWHVWLAGKCACILGRRAPYSLLACQTYQAVHAAITYSRLIGWQAG